MSCHPRHHSPTADPLAKEFYETDEINPRAIRRQHRFPFNEHPQDPDAHPDSPWHYVRVEHYTPTLPDNRDQLAQGGPESGIPCQRSLNGDGTPPVCGEMTRIVKEITLEEIVHSPGVEVVGDHPDFTKIDADDTLLILACPKCKTFMQWRRRFLPKRGA